MTFPNNKTSPTVQKKENLQAWNDSQEENTAELLYFLGGQRDFT